jgi:dTDP-4-dehydrorhamnose 3,5-epimerase
LHWHAQVLSPENGAALLLPAGFAHGFQSLSDHTELLYVHSHPHHGPAEGGLHPMCPDLALPWPQRVSEWSERDRQLPTLAHGFEGVDL